MAALKSWSKLNGKRIMPFLEYNNSYRKTINSKQLPKASKGLSF